MRQKLLPRQEYFCRDKRQIFVATNISLDGKRGRCTDRVVGSWLLKQLYGDGLQLAIAVQEHQGYRHAHLKHSVRTSVQTSGDQTTTTMRGVSSSHHHHHHHHYQQQQQQKNQTTKHYNQEQTSPNTSHHHHNHHQNNKTTMKHYN